MKVSDKKRCATFGQLHVIIIKCKHVKLDSTSSIYTNIFNVLHFDTRICIYTTVKLCVFIVDDDDVQPSKRLLAFLSLILLN